MKPQIDLALQAQDGGRRAALAIHALREPDRAWILQQLPSAQRERLDALLAELKALAIPANPILVQEMLAAAPAVTAATAQVQRVTPAAQAGGMQQQLDAIARLEPALVLRLLQGEPAGLIAHLLNVQHWPWQGALLELLGVVKRRRVEEALDGLRRQLRPKAPAALNRSLVETLHARVAAEAVLARAAAVPVIATREPTRESRRNWPLRLRDALVLRTKGRA